MSHNCTARDQPVPDAGQYVLVPQNDGSSYRPDEPLKGGGHSARSNYGHREADTKGGFRRCIGSWFVESDVFQSFIACIILCNCVVMGLETDYPHQQQIWTLLERVCLGTFVFELFTRIVFLGKKFCSGIDCGWNTFDCIVVVAGLIDFALEMLFPEEMEEESGSRHGPHRKHHGLGDLSIIFRSFRIMRILRVFRLFKVLTQLYMIIMSFAECLMSVFWISVLATLVLFICGVFLTRSLGQPLGIDVLHDGDMDGDAHDAAVFYATSFGTVPQSMFTLFTLMATPDLTRMTTAMNNNPGATIFFICYIVFGSFAILAILTGVISESMVSKGQVRRENMRFEEEQKLKAVRDNLRKHFNHYDVSGDGLLSREEFMAAIPEILELLKETEGDIVYSADDLLMVYDLMDLESGGELDIEEFLKGMEQFDCRIHQVPLQIMKFQALVMKRHNMLQAEVKEIKDQLQDIHTLLVKGPLYHR